MVQERLPTKQNSSWKSRFRRWLNKDVVQPMFTGGDALRLLKLRSNRHIGSRLSREDKRQYQRLEIRYRIIRFFTSRAGRTISNWIRKD